MSRFNVFRSAQKESRKESREDQSPGVTGVELTDAEGFSFNNVAIEGFDTGLRADRAEGQMNRTRFRRNRRSIVTKDGKIKMTDVDIE